MLTDEECIEFLYESGVLIPSIYEEEIECAPFVRSIIKTVSTDPNALFAYGSKELQDFALAIKAALNERNGNKASLLASQYSSSNILQDNTVYGTWHSEYLDYNCYAYAIGYNEWICPGQIEWVSMGNDSANFRYNATANIQTIASWIEDDLVSLGYTVSTPTTVRPSVTVSDHHHLICVRKDNDVSLDFHLMKLGTDGKWLHKPGNTIPLKYKYTPSMERVWTSEGYSGQTGQYYRNTDITYDSTIYFIEYTTPHSWTYKYCGNGQHIRTCSICDQTVEPALSCVYVNHTCRLCGSYNNVLNSVGGNEEATVNCMYERE